VLSEMRGADTSMRTDQRVGDHHFNPSLAKSTGNKYVRHVCSHIFLCACRLTADKKWKPNRVMPNQEFSLVPRLRAVSETQRVP